MPAWSAQDISVDQTFPKQPGHIGTRLEAGTNNDARMTLDIDFNGSQKQGTILLIGGRWVLVQGFSLDPGFEIESIDQVVLNAQLVMALLNRALPTGAPNAAITIHVKHADTSEPIRLHTASVSVQYGPPWRVDGTVHTPPPEAPTSYQMLLSFANAGQATTATTTLLSGSFASHHELVIEDGMPLAPWGLYQMIAQPDRYRLKPATSAAATIGELRRL